LNGNHISDYLFGLPCFYIGVTDEIGRKYYFKLVMFYYYFSLRLRDYSSCLERQVF